MQAMDEAVNPVDIWLEVARRCWPDAEFDDEAVAAARAYCDATG